MSVLPILGGLRYYPSDDLARVFGHVAAESISSRAGDIGRTMKKIGKSIAEQISDFSREPESLLSTKPRLPHGWKKWTNCVTTLPA